MVKKVINVLSTVLLVVLVALVIVLFAVRLSGNSPAVFGYHVFRVSSGSMEPTLKMGDVIISKETPADEIRIDDIITYKSEVGEMKGEMITHRVVDEPENKNGIYFFQTKGDVEGAALDPVITYDQVEGVYISKVPLLDKLYSFFFTPYGLIIFVFFIIALFGYEMISLILSYRAMEEKDDDYYEPKTKKPSKKRKKK